MFTRSELEIKTIAELRDMCRKYGVKPTGNAGYKTSYITTLMAFPAIALNQLQQRRGLRRLSFEMYQNLAVALDQMDSPTDEQSALIKLSLEGRFYESPKAWEQQRLVNLYRAKLKLEEVIDLLGE
ncbi:MULTISPECIES: hypothetical protein [unclassified Nostoc]|uniref:hypothetical protein n=1 Tax=unclassified Nostoc TaxID=2593658 RepID=UPI002AD4A2C6|nr:hypothetical protein [Nostoc sp. DedQUE03]MDZ7974732.1 hypothetical protein [Nostoc sp. DedQUE03]MDZ8048045.1 hypothetical protein [Nostoc sp. DedQUE02]